MDVRLPSGQIVIVDLAPPVITELNLGGWTNPIGQLKDWIVEKLAAAASAVWGLIQKAWDGIIKAIHTYVSTIASIVTWVKDNLTKVADWVWAKISAAWDAIIKGIQATVGAISSAVTWIRDNLGKIADWVWDKLRAAWDAIIRGIQTTVGTIWSTLKDFAEKAWGVLQRVGAIVMDAVGAVATAIFGAIKDFLAALANVVWTAVKALASAIEAAFGWVHDKIRSAISTICDLLVKLKPEDPDEVPTKVPLLLGTMAAMGTGTMVALDAVSTRVFGSGLDLTGVKSFIRDVFSPGLVQGVLIGTIVSQGWGGIIGRWVQRTFRTWLPTPEEAYTMWRQGYISETELRKILADHGTPERWMAARIDLADYTPPISELLRVAQYTDLDLEWLRGKLKENRVAETDEPKYVELFEQIALKRIHTELWTAVEGALAYGAPPEADFIRLMEEAKIRAYIRPYYVLIYRLQLNKQRVRWWLEAWEEQLYRGLITPETFVERCLTIGVDKQYAVARATYQMARRGVKWELPSQ